MNESSLKVTDSIRLELNNAYGGESALFVLPSTYISISDEMNEVYQIIKFMSDEYPELIPILEKYLSTPDRKTSKFLDSLQSLCNDFNLWIGEKPSQEFKRKKAGMHQIKFIMQFIYNRAVTEPDKLNQYEPFSPQVYGETSFELIEQMLSRVNYLNENDIFLDLGSGVGNVVLHVSAMTKCKRCYGFEKAEWPAFYASRMEKEFKFWMNFFGKTFSDFRLFKADFLAKDEYVEIEEEEWPKFAKYEVASRPHSIPFDNYVREIINDANLIFVNNYVFGAELDHQLKLRFKEMLEGALIVSSKPFCPLNFRINERNLNDIGTILNVSEFEPLNGHVSWTDKPINYYFHKIDRTLLEKYFESKKNPSIKNHKHEEPNEGKYTAKHSPKSVSSNCSSNSNGSTSPSTMSSFTSSSNPSSPGSSISDHTKANELKTIHDDKIKRGRPPKDKSKKSSTLSMKRKRKSSANQDHRRRDSEDIKKKKNRKSSSKTASSHQHLNELERKTLEKMHETTILQTKNEATKINSENFNGRSITKLSGENLDNKRLQDAEISAKIYKMSMMPTLSLNKLDSHNGCDDDNDDDDDDENGWDEMSIRRELGQQVIEEVDNYFRKCRKQYIKYLLCMKSPEYKNSLLMRLNNGNAIKKEATSKKEELEIQKSKLIKANTNLIKLKAAEIGLKDLKSPWEILEYAKNTYSRRKELEEKSKGKIASRQNQSCLSDLKRLIRVVDQSVGSSPSSKRDDSNTHHNSRQSSPFSSSDSTDTANSGSPALDEESSTNSPISKSKKLNQKSTTLSDQTTVIKDIQKQQHEQLRGFKIPKQASIQHSHKTVDSNSNGSNDSHGNSNTNHNNSHQLSNSYYHPKKNHYMMYMMENKGCSQQSNSDSEKSSGSIHRQPKSAVSFQSTP